MVNRHSIGLILVLTSTLACASLRGDAVSPGETMQRDLAKVQAARAAASEAPEPRRETPAELIGRGDSLRKNGDHGRALWSYLRAHALDRTDPRPLERIGTLHLPRDARHAEEIFHDLIDQTSGSALARTGLGLAYAAQGSWDAAELQLREAVWKDPELPAAQNALGVVLEHNGLIAEARTYYESASKLQPRSYEPLNNLGVSFLATEEYDAAVEQLSRAVQLEPRDPAVFNNLGVALGRTRRYEDALEAFRHGGDEQAALNNLGYVQYLNGDYREAVTTYERSLLIQSDKQHRLDVLRNLHAAREALKRRSADAPPAAPGSD